MFKIKKLASAAAIAALTFAASDLAASAQSNLTNGPAGTRPNTLSSDSPSSANGNAPSRAIYHRQGVRPMRSSARSTSYADRRPLTVRRTGEAAIVAAPVVVANSGPGTFVTGPLGFGSSVVALPFRGLNAIFPATGDVGSNPLILIGAPLRAIADIVQVPFRIIGTPFGGTTIATY